MCRGLLQSFTTARRGDLNKQAAQFTCQLEQLTVLDTEELAALPAGRRLSTSPCGFNTWPFITLMYSRAALSEFSPETRRMFVPRRDLRGVFFPKLSFAVRNTENTKHPQLYTCACHFFMKRTYDHSSFQLFLVSSKTFLSYNMIRFALLLKCLQ